MSGKRNLAAGNDDDAFAPQRKRLSLSRSKSVPSSGRRAAADESTVKSRSGRKGTNMSESCVDLQSLKSNGSLQQSGVSGHGLASCPSLEENEVLTCSFCPSCQVPLVGRDEAWCSRHIGDCLDFPSRPSQECPDGLKCTSCMPSHFHKLGHRALASRRCNATPPSPPLPPSVTATVDAGAISAGGPQPPSLNLLISPTLPAKCSGQVIGPLPLASKKKLERPRPPAACSVPVTSLRGSHGNVEQATHASGSTSTSTSTGSTCIAQNRTIGQSSNHQVQTNLATFFKVPPPPPAQPGQPGKATQHKAMAPTTYGALRDTSTRHGGATASLPSTSHQTRGESSSLNSSRLMGQARGAASAPASLEDETDGAAVSRVSSKHKRKQCPFYKRIPGTCFTVDAFSYGSVEGCRAYFLSHFHSDHYQGLNKSFSHPIYCSKSTGNLCVSQLRVSAERIHTLQMNETTKVHGVLVTPIDANHCPGSVMFIFQLPDGRILLHTGDFRSSDCIIQSPHLRGLRYDTIYLDTTYLDPKYDFPPQEACVEFAVLKAREAVATNPKTLIVTGTYSIGKERVFLAIAEALGSKVAVTTKKKAILDQLDWPELTNRLTADWSAAQVHVLSMMQISFKGMAEHKQKFGSQYSCIVGFRPTGWSQNNKSSVHGNGSAMPNILPSFRDGMILYNIPYSEHSSFSELKRFVQHFRPNTIQPTVNVGSEQSRQAMQRYFNQWLPAK